MCQWSVKTTQPHQPQKLGQLWDVCYESTARIAIHIAPICS